MPDFGWPALSSHRPAARQRDSPTTGLRQLLERLGKGTAALRGRSGKALEPQLLERHEFGLSGRQIARLQILAELLESLIKLLHVALDALLPKMNGMVRNA
jgi:hypothetical protein